MRFSLVFAAFLALLIPQPRVLAQNTPVTVEVELDQDQFLPLEDIKVAVRIVNLTGRTLHMGADNGWVKFIVETKDGTVSFGFLVARTPESLKAKLAERGRAGVRAPRGVTPSKPHS